MSDLQFLLTVSALVLVGAAYEVYAYMSGRRPTISWLARRHPALRLLIDAAILLLLVWWAAHSSPRLAALDALNPLG